MKQSSSEKYTVAWFKLAEFVSRGEKERALAMYRLLAHSLDDVAFVRQLEGDLLLSFNDPIAYEKYIEAARLYAHKGKLTEAAAIFEHLISFSMSTQEHVLALIELYKELSKEIRVFESMQHIVRSLMEKKEFMVVSFILHQIDSTSVQFVAVHQELVQQWAASENPPLDSIMAHAKTVIDYYFGSQQEKTLQTFLMALKMVHLELYQKACGYMQEVHFK
jgi:tetratricopeptide (TPR) repeat protein